MSSARATASGLCGNTTSSSSSSSSSSRPCAAARALLFGRRTATAAAAAAAPAHDRCRHRRRARLAPAAHNSNSTSTNHHPSRPSAKAAGLRSALAASLSPGRRRRRDEDNDDGEYYDDDENNTGPAPPPRASAAAIVVTGFAPDECAYCRETLGLPLVAATRAMLDAPLSQQAELAAAELEAALARDAEAAAARAQEAAPAGDEAGGGDDDDDGDGDGSASTASFFSSSSGNNNNGGSGGNSGGKSAAAAAAAAAACAPSLEDALALGRTALFVGDPSFAAEYAGSLNDALVADELWPAVVAASPAKHAARPLRDALLAIREAHARRHRLVQPLRVDPALAAVPSGAALVMNLEVDASEAVPIAATAAAAAMAAAGGAAGAATSAFTRRDASHVVVIDGLVTDDERAELLAALTAPGHDPASPPPADKWEARLVDRAGEPPTWGLRASAIRSLLRNPPRALVALQSRLSALYPEYTLCAMPAAAMRGGWGEEDDEDDDDGQGPYVGGGEDDEDDEEEEEFIAPIVANAVAPGDSCALHVDADPSLLPADAPFSIHYGGPFFNREPGPFPLFVSAMVYLNPVWEDDWHAETLFTDPATGVGAFSAAKPGRVVLIEQDVTHRIGAPSAVRAPGLRYSLVLKTVWLPKSGAKVTGSNGISRPEWGPPQQLGSAARAIGPRGREIAGGGGGAAAAGGGAA